MSNENAPTMTNSVGASAPPHTSVKVKVISPRALNGPGIRAGFSLRHGGVSPEPFHTLNLGLSTGDDPANVLTNRRRLFNEVGLSPESLAIAGQVHGSDVHVVDEPGLFPGYDALITGTRGVVLGITSADCAVVLLADPDASVIAACHSGWRGTVARAAGNTVSAMKRLGARSGRIRAYVSPCISTENFEVGPEVAAQFDAPYVVERPEWPRPHVDLRRAIADQLVECGLHPDAIEISERCTVAETADFFSYRAENATTGRMMGFISLI